MASIYQFYSPKRDFCAEFHSLSLDPLVAVKNGKELWTPKEPGVVLKPFDDAAEPSPSKPQRLVENADDNRDDGAASVLGPDDAGVADQPSASAGEALLQMVA